MADQHSDTTENNLRLVIIGETGTGKSETANSILMDPQAFHSEASAESVTSICKIESREVFGTKISIVDTPGLFDTGKSNEQMIKEIIRCIFMSSPGPHAILLTLRISRLTEQVQKSVTLFKEYFGKESTKYMIVIFTFKDDLAARRGRPEKSIQDYVAGITENDVRKVLRECNGRYVAFNNQVDPDSTDNEEQVRQLLALIQRTKAENQNSFYSNKMLEEAEEIMKERENEIRKELQKERKAKEEEIKKKYEGELKEKLLADMRREYDAQDPRYTARKQMENRTWMDAFKDSLPMLIELGGVLVNEYGSYRRHALLEQKLEGAKLEAIKQVRTQMRLSNVRSLTRHLHLGGKAWARK